MANRRNRLAFKAIFCLVLCTALAAMHWRNAEAQTSAATPPTASTPTPTPLQSPPIQSPPIAAAPVSNGPGAGQSGAPSNSIAATGPAPAQSQPILSAAATNPVNRVSMLGLVRNSDPIVQAVMAFLLLCSVLSWATFIYKSFALAIARQNTSRFSQAFQSAVTMDDAGNALAAVPSGAASRMWLAAKREWDLTLSATGTPLAADQTNRLLQRLALAMGSAQERSLTRLGNWMGLLATIGSTAPFIGLFGTVWGILDSFEHISASYNTSLTVVAPGIAEALLATAAGLFAAIPATMFYNRFAREVGKITGMLDNVTADLVVFASRDVERLHK